MAKTFPNDNFDGFESTFEIALNGTTSSAVEMLTNGVPILFFPATFTGTSVTFMGCNTIDGTYKDVVDDFGTSLSVTVSADKAVACLNTYSALCSFRYLKLKCTAQAAARSVIVFVRE